MKTKGKENIESNQRLTRHSTEENVLQMIVGFSYKTWRPEEIEVLKEKNRCIVYSWGHSSSVLKKEQTAFYTENKKEFIISRLILNNWLMKVL